jgi:uncharacterized protein YlbG (UPF0298 family)
MNENLTSQPNRSKRKLILLYVTEERLNQQVEKFCALRFIYLTIPCVLLELVLAYL